MIICTLLLCFTSQSVAEVYNATPLACCTAAQRQLHGSMVSKLNMRCNVPDITDIQTEPKEIKVKLAVPGFTNKEVVRALHSLRKTVRQTM